MDARAAIAAIRFGLGRRPGEAVPADPAAWLERQLDPRLPAPSAPPGTSLAEIVAALAADREDRPAPASPERPGGMEPSAAGMEPPVPRVGPRRTQLIARAEMAHWMAHAITTEAPFRERLASFWTNHFTVSRGKGLVHAFAGHYVREAIRPHVVGRFSDMLLAVARHPAMLMFLDNAQSIGPNSPAGQRLGRGLNENLAREILELHTVTPAARYTQGDVTEFARILTGWSVARPQEGAGFLFRPRAHEPGEKTLLGRRFPEGEEGGVAALRFLAENPATYRNLATRLVRHFVADDPPRDAVERLFAVLRDTRGDLGAASRALVRLPQAWSPPLTKIRAPVDYIVAALRALEAPPAAAERFVQATQFLGQPLWAAPAPNGWADVAREWTTPEALLRRVEWANGLAGFGAGRDAAAIAEAVMGPLLRAETVEAVRRAGSARDALTLVLASPEFMRR
ncbi:MAG TPA: DUF1800 domain-containing protein [Acetobacteraceae bacterium]|nr:DUF1800 domain-containing protein [Acetobacteraceae bacterium]